MTINRVKLFATALFTLSMVAIAILSTNPKASAVPFVDEDVAATYKTKCSVCHSPKAEKFFDAAKTDEELTGIVLKGKKGEKPPFMPAFETKGMTAEQAKALVTYMKQLKEPAK
jgi:mono/diheme cytochrome c family protein